MINVTFLMEQQIGHRTFYNNLRKFMDDDSRIAANWVEISYFDPANFWQSWPIVPSSIRGSLVGRSQVKQGLANGKGDVAFFNTQVPAALVGRRGIKRPYILCTDITPIQYDSMGEHYGHQPDTISFIAQYKHRVNRELFQGAYRIIPWSNWVKDSLINDYAVPEHKITVIPPGVDLSVWQYFNKEQSDGPMRILFIGGDFYRKGGEILVKAFENLPDGIAELVLVTRSEIPAQKNIHVYNDMTPNSPQLIKLCQTCDIFVLPTNAEAFGIAAVEASAMGLPVIGTAVGGLTDIVKHNQTGFVINPGDTSSLTNYLLEMAEDTEKRQQFGREARKRTEQLFNAQINAQLISEILQEAA
ncbi:MAG: glycosyltransferase family 4 protein [Ardenticatenaceae bacterium]|nr:glycosyltransferase family 4 protein [Ardenticatenaceae bacterium]MCB9442660.1 glycosyltransferase family 4 protein [Ardenticatenaceae bacterium]